MEQLQDLGLSPMSAFGATLLRFVLAGFWIIHWCFKVGYRGMAATEAFRPSTALAFDRRVDLLLSVFALAPYQLQLVEERTPHDLKLLGFTRRGER
jgi:hypothetical protein